MYYLAYGSNLNKGQMKRRCPDARPVGKTMLHDMQLVFRRGYLTIEYKEGESVPVGIWWISATDEEALDRYEGVPKFYHKEIIQVPYEGSFKTEIPCLVYIMNDGFPIQRGSREYRMTVKAGYDDFGFEYGPLIDADLEAYDAQDSFEEYKDGSTTVYTTKNTTKLVTKTVIK